MSRIVKARPHPPQRITVRADEAERAALCARLAIVALESLEADIAFTEDGEAIAAHGALVADVIQQCAVSGEDFPVHIEEPLALRFVRSLREAGPDEEIEFGDETADEIEFDGESFDIGEAVTQSLALAIDPYAVGPMADAARREAGIVDETAPRGALAEALAALKKD